MDRYTALFLHAAKKLRKDSSEAVPSAAVSAGNTSANGASAGVEVIEILSSDDENEREIELEAEPETVTSRVHSHQSMHVDNFLGDETENVACSSPPHERQETESEGASEDDDDDDQLLVAAVEETERTLTTQASGASWLEVAKTTVKTLHRDIGSYFGLRKLASAPPAPAAPQSAKPPFRRWPRSDQGPRPVIKCPFYKWIPNTKFTVDAFRYGEIEGCQAYFLTHFHSDHYIGLAKSFVGELYCSPVTAALVRFRLCVDALRIRTIPFETPTLVHDVLVTLLDANHCPGAAIIIFALPNNGPVHLHTGDFRANDSMADHPLLRHTRIASLFLDTTYCDEQYRFPAQQTVIDKAVAIALEAAMANPRLLVVAGAYLIGKERIFLAIAEAIDARIWTSHSKRQVLELLAMPHLTARLCNSKAEARVHVVDMNTLALAKLTAYLEENPQFNALLAIRPTGWTHSQDAGDITNLKPHRRGHVTLYGLPYSEHSSFTELCNFTRSIRPQRVIPTVNVGSAAKRSQMEKYFKTWLAASQEPKE